MFDINTKTSEYMSIVVTHSCNRNCKFCVDSKINLHGNISFNSIRNAINFAKQKNIKDVLLVGGEPTLHKDIINIASYIKMHDLRVILTSNFDNIDKIYALDPFVDCFNFSYYGQSILPDPCKFKHTDITLSTLIYKRNLDTKKKLDDFIDKYGNNYNLKFSTLTNCNEFCKNNQFVSYLDHLNCEWVVLFNEILGQIYRGFVIKRYDKIINTNAKQSYKCDIDGKISTHW